MAAQYFFQRSPPVKMHPASRLCREWPSTRSVQSVDFSPNLRRLSWHWLWLVFPFRDDSRRRQEDDLATFQRSSFSLQLFRQGVPTLATKSYSLSSISFCKHSLLSPHKSQRIMAPSRKSPGSLPLRHSALCSSSLSPA